MESPHDLYERLGCVIVAGHMSAAQNKKGEWKKAFGFPGKWQTMQKHNYNKKATGFAMRTGHDVGMTAIDIDDPNLECAQTLMALMVDCNMIQQTKKGFHYVYAYNASINQTTGTKETGIDTRNNGGCIFVEPSKAAKPDGELVADYKWITYPEEGEALMEIPEAVLDFLGKMDHRYIVEDEEAASVEEMEDAKETEETSVETTTTEPRNEDDRNLLAVVEALPIKHLDTYADWVKIGMVFHNEGYSCADWVAVSKRSKGWEAGCCEAKWASFNKATGRKVSAASLWKMLKDSNPNAFWGLMETRQDFWNIISLINHKDIAKYFYNIHPDAYVWEEMIGWYCLEKSNIWKHSEKNNPSGLKRHIADTLQELVMDTKRAELALYQKKSLKLGMNDRDGQKALTKEHNEKLGKINNAYKMFGSSDFCNGVISFLPSFYEVENLSDLIDGNRQLFAFADGVYDLQKGCFRMITPQDYISTTTGYPYPRQSNPTARAGIKKFITSMFENDDTEKYVLQVLSTCLLGENRFQEFYVFTGSGANGKGAVDELLRNTWGEYYYSVDNTLFTKPLERKDQPIPALVIGKSKRIMMTTEPESDEKLQGGLLKKISGNDIVEARTLNSKNIIRYVPPFKVIIQANAIPELNRLDGGIQRRMSIIEFPFKFVSANKVDDQPYHRLGDPDVRDKSCKSPEWRNEFFLMLAEVYKGIKDWKDLPRPNSVTDATGDYLDGNNPVKAWLNANYDITNNDKDKVGASELKRAFIEATHAKEMADAKFKSLMSFNNIKNKRTAVGQVYFGLKRKDNIADVSQ
jgi:P4 family phage/plasmid primase-like protien